MNATLSPKEWQILSEYIDGRLSSTEKARLERSLQDRPELKTGLEELRRTRAILRAAPRRKVPHNFTLTQTMAAEQRRAPSAWFPALSFSSAAAIVLLILSIVLQPPASLKPAAYSQQAAAPAAAPLAATAPATAQDATQTPMILTWGDQNEVPYGSGRGGGGGPSTFSNDMSAGSAPETGAIPLSPAVPPEQFQKALPVSPYPGPAGSQPEVQSGVGAAQQPDENPQTMLLNPTATAPNLNSAATEAPQKQNAPLSGNGPIVGVAPTEEQGKIQAAPTSGNLSELQSVQNLRSFDWRPIQAALAVIAVLCGMGALGVWMRRER